MRGLIKAPPSSNGNEIQIYINKQNKSNEIHIQEKQRENKLEKPPQNTMAPIEYKILLNSGAGVSISAPPQKIKEHNVIY